MLIIETSAFTRRIQALLSDDDYSRLQDWLVRHPDAGDVMPEGGGIRKLRWAVAGRGKQGGARIIYFWAVSPQHLFMLRAYAKNERADLTRQELKALRRAVEEEYP
jgi:hypothetical protein